MTTTRPPETGADPGASSLAEEIEHLEGVLAAAVRFQGDSPSDVYVAALPGYADSLGRSVDDVLRRAGLPLRPGLVRIETVAGGASPDDARPLAARTAESATADAEAPAEAVDKAGAGQPSTGLGSPLHGEPPLEPAPAFEPVPPLERRVELEYAPLQRRFLLLHGLDLQRSESHVTCSVELLRRGESFRAECTELDSEMGRARAAARATLLAAEQASACSLALEGAQTAELFGRRYVVLSVEASVGRRFTVLSGILALDDERSVEEAAALATLHAIERFISG